MKARYTLALSLLTTPALHAQTGNVGIGTTNPQARLHTTGSVRHDTLAGAGTRLITADADGRLIPQPAFPYPTNDTAKPIAANGCSSGIGAASSIQVTGLPTAVPSANIKVRVNIFHSYASDVRAYLVAPNGAILNLLYGNGSSGSDFINTIFWDGASAAVPGFVEGGVWLPTGNSSPSCGIAPTVITFGGIGGGSIVPNGTWTLRVYDVVMADAGTLNNWSISFNGRDPVYSAASGIFANGVVPRGEAGTLIPGTISDPGDGNIGIGTAAPLLKLDAFNGSIGLRNFAGWDHVYISHTANEAFIRAGGADNGLILAAGNGISGSYGEQSYTEGLRIMPTGNVGVGNGSTVNAKLDVAGTTETDALRINTGGAVKDFAVKNDAAGNVGFRKGFRGVTLLYIIATKGCFPLSGIPADPLACQYEAMVGEVKLFSGTSIPAGWAECNGQLLPINTNQALFSIIGTLYGGNGTQNFAVPDLRGSVPVGVGNNGTNNWGLGEQN